MQDKRASRQRITPRSEDAGLFMNEVCRVDVFICPVMAHNRRGDIILTGFVKGDHEIRVLFAGRRVQAVRRLIDVLKSLRAGQQLGNPLGARHPVQVTGRWRRKNSEDAQGFVTREYELAAAHWTFKDLAGRPCEGGQLPEI